MPVRRPLERRCFQNMILLNVNSKVIEMITTIDLYDMMQHGNTGKYSTFLL